MSEPAQSVEKRYEEGVDLLKRLIALPSLSGEEEETAEIIRNFLEERGVETHRLKNNIWCRNRKFDPGRPTILLNSHHDTVPPGSSYTRDPHRAEEENGILYGLGSNDAGGPLVSLIALFLVGSLVTALGDPDFARQVGWNLLVIAGSAGARGGLVGIRDPSPRPRPRRTGRADSACWSVMRGLRC